jgi:hypothetical protein
MRMSDLNIKSIGEKMLEGVGFLAGSENLIRIKQRIETDGIKSKDDIASIVRLICTSVRSAGQISAVEQMKEGISVGSFLPFYCNICRQPMKGALYEPGTDIGIQYQRGGIRPMHEACAQSGYPLRQ